MRFSPVTTLASLLLSASLLPACGGGETSSSTAGGGSGGSTATGGGGAGGATAGAGGTGGATGFVMQPHPPFPTIPGEMSAVIAHPKLITVTFQDNPDTAKIQAVGDALVASDWLVKTGADYGIGAGTHLAKFTLPMNEPANLQESDVLGMIDQQIQSGALPPLADDVVYMIFTAKGTNFNDDLGYQMCTDYLGYHWQTDIPSGTITYGFAGDCDIGFQEVTATFAHELIEIASDPGFTGGYFFDPGSADPWYPLAGLENADMCDTADYVVENGNTYQRVWSNSAAAAAVTSPCAPVDPAEVFYNVYADPPMIPKVSAGQSAEFTLTGWSAGPVADWTIDFDAEYYSTFTPQVELSANTINNGKTVTVKLTVPPGTPKNRLGTAMIYSGDGYGRFWPVSVRSQ